MFAVIFEVEPTAQGKAEYLEIASRVREFLKDQKGFISIERFQSLADEAKVLSLSFWEDEASIDAWRSVLEHRTAQNRGRNALFSTYRIRVAEVTRDYTISNRDQAPQ